MSASSSKSKRPLMLFDVGVKRRKAIEDTTASVSEVKGYKFTSSGREDVDVKMLGSGRPFAVEFLHPRKANTSQEEIDELQERINASSEDIKIQSLQFVTKADLSILKEGEEEKVKHYSALVVAPEGVGSEKLESLKKLKNVVLSQKTPIRVLHRRTLSARAKTVYSISADPIDDQHFRLKLSTQAGTYIKEFVHGDFGRTKPSLGSILDTETDIVELDVEAVDLEWPPPKPCD